MRPAVSSARIRAACRLSRRGCSTTSPFSRLIAAAGADPDGALAHAEALFGAGAFALSQLEDEAAARGLNYVVNVVRDTHPQRDAVTAWFQARGFLGTDDGRLRKQVGDRTRDIGQHQGGRPGTGKAVEPDEARRTRYLAERQRAEGRPRSGAPDAGSEPMGPGVEEQGGYVDQAQHRY